MNYGIGLIEIRKAIDVGRGEFATMAGMRREEVEFNELSPSLMTKSRIIEIVDALQIDRELYTILCLEESDVKEDNLAMYKMMHEALKENALKIITAQFMENKEEVSGLLKIIDPIKLL